MARIASASPRTNGEPRRPARRSRAFAFPLLLFAFSGCETLERMDYLDRFFEAAPRPGPVITAETVPDPASAATAEGTRSDLVVAMEPIPNPAAPSATDRVALPGRVRAAEPRPGPAPPSEVDTELRTRLLVRQNQWLTQFWMELTPAQRSRVERQLRRGNVQPVAGRTDAAGVWDAMGLADRAKLVFGDGPPSERPIPAERRDGAVWAGSS